MNDVITSRINLEDNHENDPEFETLNFILSDYEVLPVSGFQLHSVRKRDVQTQSHLERLVSFRALQSCFGLATAFITGFYCAICVWFLEHIRGLQWTGLDRSR
ncbi:hypothetical protein ILYODFUR_034460 [Ilyodon furcidens]|uniref:Uncharacterized protein n=1 Tax=Ilyodon furcidens TaxID=33524 RepID=A0ABV0T420_9TELE